MMEINCPGSYKSRDPVTEARRPELMYFSFLFSFIIQVDTVDHYYEMFNSKSITKSKLRFGHLVYLAESFLKSEERTSTACAISKTIGITM